MKKKVILYLGYFVIVLLFCASQDIAWGRTHNLVYLAFGDSITAGVGSSSGGPQTGYPLLLEQKLESAFPGNFFSINAGLGGEVLYFAVERFQEALDTYNPDLVLLMEGTNDLNDGTPFDDMENSLRTMVLYALNRGKKVIIGTIAPVTFSSDVQGAIAAFNPRIYQIAADYNIPVARVFESMTAVEGWETKLIDPITLEHPNDAGYQVVRDAFFEQVSALIDSGLLKAGDLVGLSDFDGDPKTTTDILWRHDSTGQLYDWLMSGSGPYVDSEDYLGTVGDPYWVIKKTADFNGDGRSDILWRHVSTGDIYLWLMGPDGKTIIGQGDLGTVDPNNPADEHNWKIEAVADFNKDGKADILWRNASTGELSLWLMDGITITSKTSLGVVNPNWKIIGVADFDHDHKPDILWRHAVTGEVFVWLMDGTTIKEIGSLGVVGDLNWQIQEVADFSGDGKADILWRHAVTGEVFVWLINGTTIASQNSLGVVGDLNWKIKGVADFDGDGKADILWRHALSGQTYIWLMNGLSVASMESPGLVSDLNWKIKGVADFDGDGKADILWRHAVTGEVFLWLMNGTTIASQRSLGVISDLNWEMK
ncbi:MAG: FG-GAP-like repeat-containing protein [Thermodesulfobacteriota bacterium]